MGIRNKLKATQIQIKAIDYPSKSLTVYNQGDVTQIYNQIYFLFERLNDAKDSGEVTITFKTR